MTHLLTFIIFSVYSFFAFSLNNRNFTDKFFFPPRFNKEPKKIAFNEIVIKTLNFILRRRWWNF